MKFEIALPCEHCHERIPVKVNLSGSSWQWTCQECGKENDVLVAPEWTLGWRILEKAVFEYLTRSDYSSSIIFSALAFEAELARLFFKWVGIDALLKESRHVEEEELEERYKSLGFAIKDRINGVSSLLHSPGLEDFVRTEPEILQRVTEGYPTLNLGSLASDFERAVFWPRNQILHAGYTGYGEDAAKTCRNVTSLALDLFGRMDRRRRSRN